VDALLDADRRRREALHALERLRAERTAASKAIRDQKDAGERERAIEAQRATGHQIAALEAAAAAGYDGVGLRLARSPLFPFHPVVGNAVLIREMKRALASSGLAVLDILSF